MAGYGPGCSFDACGWLPSQVASPACEIILLDVACGHFQAEIACTSMQELSSEAVWTMAFARVSPIPGSFTAIGRTEPQK